MDTKKSLKICSENDFLREKFLVKNDSIFFKEIRKTFGKDFKEFLAKKNIYLNFRSICEERRGRTGYNQSRTSISWPNYICFVN